MSFKTDLESLIANANSSLLDLESIVGRARTLPTDANGSESMPGDEMRRQLDTVYQRLSASLVEIQKSYHHDQERLSNLEGELKLDLENVRQCAIDYFIKGQYRECISLLNFLAKVQPNDEDLEHFLELSRKKQFENELLSGGLLEKGSASGGEIGRIENDACRPSDQTVPEPLEAAVPPPPDDRPPISRPQRDRQRDLSELQLKNSVACYDDWDKLQPTRRRPIVWIAAAGLLLAIAAGLFRLFEEVTSDSAGETELAVTTSTGRSAREAQQLFDAGAFQAAQWACDEILARDAQNAFALDLKGRIQKLLEEQKTQTASATPDAEKIVSTILLSQSLGVRSGAGPSQNQPQPANTAPLKAPASPIPQVPTRVVQTQAPPIRSSPRETLSVSNQPAAAAPAPVSVSRQMSREEALELSSSIEAKEFSQARALLGKLETAFPGNPEVKILADRLTAEVAKQQNVVRSWIDKAEVAQIAGRYVTPPDDNVLIYCNQALKLDPGNQRASYLKRETVGRSVAQAEDWIQRGKFDAARLFYASMDYLAQSDNAFPYPKADLKRELDKLAYKSFSMIHDHRLGGCSGVLKFNAYGVSYVPSGGSGDGFSENLNAIVLNAEGDRLRISYRDRAFRFRRENGGDVQAIYQQLMSRMTDEKSTLVTRSRSANNP